MKEESRKKPAQILQGLSEAGEEEKDRKFVRKLGKYMFGNYEVIKKRLVYEEVGSCAEGQISHMLSEAFSRNPMGWSKEGLGKLTKQRILREAKKKGTATANTGNELWRKRVREL